MMFQVRKTRVIRRFVVMLAVVMGLIASSTQGASANYWWNVVDYQIHQVGRTWEFGQNMGHYPDQNIYFYWAQGWTEQSTGAEFDLINNNPAFYTGENPECDTQFEWTVLWVNIDYSDYTWLGGHWYHISSIEVHTSKERVRAFIQTPNLELINVPGLLVHDFHATLATDLWIYDPNWAGIRVEVQTASMWATAPYGATSWGSVAGCSDSQTVYVRPSY
jgi:hypothetical protein